MRLRYWSVRRARFLMSVYNVFMTILSGLHPLMSRLDIGRIEKPVNLVERNVKGMLFDCRMCGSCVLNATGMSCPMNCPKELRNGPCGGVRQDSNCEIKPDMKCVWVAAFEGSRSMDGGKKISEVLPPLDHRLSGNSSWLREAGKQASGENSRAC